MADEQKTTTEANRRISRGDADETTTPRPPAENEVAEANDRISREAERAREQLRREQALKRPPD